VLGPPWVRYSVAVALVGSALAARFVMLPANGGLAFNTFYPAVTAAVLLFGDGPGLLAIVLSATCAMYFFLPPYHSFAIGSRYFISLGFFLLTCGLTCFLGHQLRAAVRVAQQALRARDEVLGFVAHDMRNPLSAIVMQAEFLKLSRGEQEPGFRDAALSIHRSAEQVSRLIQDLLDVTRVEAGHVLVERSRVPVSQLISDAVEAQESIAAAASVDLRLEVARDVPDVWADRDRLLQVFGNLVGNALKFTPPGGHIRVGAAALNEDEVQFWVADTGAGIAAEDLPHVFDRFWQAHKGERRGTGLGLTIVKGIMEAHAGRIWVESALGMGTTFFFALPPADQTVGALQ
jgi:signal transduction histidine kinase